MPVRSSTGIGKSTDASSRLGSQNSKPSERRRQTYVKPTAAGGFGTTRPSSGVGASRPSLQQRKTMAATRPSTASRPSTGRSSVYGAGGSSGVKKDPRPLSERSYQNESIKKLIRFLDEKDYPSKTLTVKRLQTPTCKEFLHILNFILGLIDESLPIDGMNIVDEVPSVLKILGYPFNVSRNHLLNVGSPHSWPILLGALSWLVDCCQIPDNTDQVLFHQGPGFGDEEEQDQKVEYEIEELMYSLYMKYGETSEEYQKMTQARREAIRGQCEELKKEHMKMQHENSLLSEKMEELSKSSLPVLQSQVQQNKADYEELVYHLENDVVPAITEVCGANAENDVKASEFEMQIEASREKVQELEEQIRHQPVSAIDARALHQSVKDAEDTLEIKRAQQAECAKRISELQMQHNRNVMLINNQCEQINGKLIRVAALLPDLASLSPLDYDTSKRADPEVLQGLLAHAKFLRDEIQKLHRGVACSIHEYESKLLSAESAQSALHTELVKKELEVANLAHTLEVTKEDLESRRKYNEEAMKSELVEKLALEDNLRSLNQRLQSEPVAEKEYITFKAQCESEMISMEKHLKDDDEQLQELVLTLTKFIEALHAHQRGVGKQVEELLEKFKEVKIPTVHPDFLKPEQ